MQTITSFALVASLCTASTVFAAEKVSTETAATTTTTTTALPERTTTTTTTTISEVGSNILWDTLGGGVVKGGHKLQLSLNAWGEENLSVQYTYGLASFMAIGGEVSAQFLHSQNSTLGLNVGVPFIFSLLNDGFISARVGITPGYFHDPINAARLNAFTFKVDPTVGFWLRRGVFMVGPTTLLQLYVGQYAVGPLQGATAFNFAFMGGAFGEFHVNSFMAVTAQVMFGAAVDRYTNFNGDFAFAYRSQLGLAFFVP